MHDSQARRIETAIEERRAVGPDVLERWVRELLADRRARTSVIQRLARQTHHLRQRLGQAARYLEGLVEEMGETAREPWPKQLPCPHCGASAELVRAVPAPGGAHVLVHDHPNGQQCAPSPAARRREDRRNGRC